MRLKRIFCKGGICVLFAIVSLFLGGGNASGQTPLTIDNPDLSMGFNDSQPLLASGGCPPYNWSLTGGGTLTPFGVYQAPSSNNNCANNAMITLTDQCKNLVDIQIAVSNMDVSIARRVLKWIHCYWSQTSPPYDMGRVELHAWRCDSVDTISCYPTGGEGPCGWCWSGPCDCVSQFKPGGSDYPCTWREKVYANGSCGAPLDVVQDFRSEAQKLAGCCPINPLTGLPFDNARPSSEQMAKEAGRPQFCDYSEGKPIDSVANPVNVATGNKYEEVLDISVSTFGIPLEFRRSYNSQIILDGSLGYGWTHNFDVILGVVQTSPTKRVRIWDSDGRALYFYQVQQTSTEILFGGESGVKDRLKQVISTGEYFLRRKEGNLTYKFGSDGKLLQISDPNGNTQSLTFTGGLLTQVSDNFGKSLSIQYSNNRIYSVTDPKNQSVTYQYQNGDLWKVTYPDTNFISYAYSNHNLTDKYDTNNNLIGHWGYDSRRRVINYYSHVKEGVNQEEINLTYPTAERTELRRTIGTNTYLTTYTTDVIDGISVVKQIEGCSTCGGENKQFGYDGLDLSLVTTIDGAETYTTQYIYDNPPDPKDKVGEIQTITEALGKPEARTANYSYTHRTDDPFLLTQSTETKPSVVAGCSQSNVITTNYDTKGNIVSRVETGCVLINGNPTQKTYTTIYEYDNGLPSGPGLLTKINGPRTDTSDIITFEYYENTVPEANNRYQLKAIVNALLQRTEFSLYDANGNVGKTKDPNGVFTQYTYDERNRVKTIKNLTTNALTEYFYDARGNLDYVILPEENQIDFSYNPANKLTEIMDQLGNKIIYGYDSQGNRNREELKDPYDVLKKSLDFVYDAAYNRLWKITNPDTTFREFRDYDGRGNPRQIKDPRGNLTDYHYDPLNRLKDMTQPGTVMTDYGYDTHDNLTSVMDPNDNTTTYVYDDFGRKNQTVSPDTGTTRYEYDEAGNLVKRVDAKGTIVNYTYDALNRLQTIQFPADPAQNITFTYDSTSVSYGIGRLTGRTDPSGTYAFHYYPDGRLKKEEKTVTGGGSYTTEYEYNKNGVLTKITYPTGRIINYTPDSVDKTRISEVSIDASPTSLATGINYLPFGGVTGLAYGNTLTLTQGYDNQYRTQSITVGPLGSVLNLTYGYDANGNITSVVDVNNPTGGPGITPPEIYSYGPGTNRLIHIETSMPIDFGYDLNANITSETGWTYVYDLSNQLIRVLQGSNVIADYTYNGAGQRVRKVIGTTIRIFHYDLRGHLISETNQNGQTLAEYIYLGDQLLAMIKPGEAVYYFHNDHLGTPRVLTDAAGSIAWKATYDPFGEATISIQAVENPFRFPGQYYDQETGLHYNYFRYYDPTTGRYITPDPIGLEGGINLFAYANNPLIFIDPLGLFESYWFLKWVPGQHLFDLGMTAFENRQYSWAAAYFAGMLGEQVLTALTFGQGTVASSTNMCGNMAGSASSGGRAFAPGMWLSHFEKHGAEFGYKTSVEYLRGAQRLTAGGQGIQTFTRTSGDRLFYDAARNEFAAVSREGFIRTYFRPIEGLQYWLHQTGGL